jgi:hypothetical protein
MNIIALVLLVVAIVCFVAAAIGIQSRVQLGWIGLACFAGFFLARDLVVVAAG